MTRFKKKEDTDNLNDRLMERIFNFPRLYRLKMQTVYLTVRTVQPWIMKNYFTFDEILNDTLPESSSVLEIGCGDGKLYQRLRSLHTNLEYIGTDINKSMIEYCRARFPDATWQSYNSLPYPYPDGHFDFCIIENVFHHLNNYEAICDLLEEAMRVAKRVVCFEPLQSDNRFLYLLKSIYWRITDGGKYYFTYDEFHKLFDKTRAKLKWEKVSKPLHQIYSCEVSRCTADSQ